MNYLTTYPHRCRECGATITTKRCLACDLAAKRVREQNCGATLDPDDTPTPDEIQAACEAIREAELNGKRTARTKRDVECTWQRRPHELREFSQSVRRNGRGVI